MRSPAARRNHPKAVEKTVPWKPWKTKPRFPTAPWKTRNLGEFPTFPPPCDSLFPSPKKTKGQEGSMNQADKSSVNKSGQIQKLPTAQRWHLPGYRYGPGRFESGLAGRVDGTRKRALGKSFARPFLDRALPCFSADRGTPTHYRSARCWNQPHSLDRRLARGVHHGQRRHDLPPLYVPTVMRVPK